MSLPSKSPKIEAGFGATPDDSQRYGEVMSTNATPQVIYDGSCGFCTNAALWLQAHVRRGDLSLVASQELDESGLAGRGLSREEVDAAVWWIDGEQRLNGHLAIGTALQKCKGMWSVAGSLITNPPFVWLAPTIYRLVARYRRFLPGGTPNCAMNNYGPLDDKRPMDDKT